LSGKEYDGDGAFPLPDFLHLVNRYAKVLSCLVLFAALWAGVEAVVGADDEPSEADWVSIRAVIGSQLDAFKRDDADTAFSLASPGIQKQFRTAGEFMHMVRTGYSAVYRPGTVRFLEHFVLSGQPVQPLEIVTPDDAVVIAFYIMERQPDGDWKIAGCALGVASARSA
jgi:Domain of unknown function (DUF4864)